MGEAFEPHFIWVRLQQLDGSWSKWWKRREHPTRMAAEEDLGIYCEHRPNASGVALPIGVRPIQRTRKGK